MKNSTTDCATAAELFPWYLNGTLSPEEAEDLEAHLETCPKCRQEHRETAFAAATYNAHPTSEQLVRYAFHELAMGSERSLLEDHLKFCSTCADEVALIEGSRDRQHEETPAALDPTPAAAPLPFKKPPQKAAPATSSWQLGAIAASLLAVLAVGYWMLQLDSPEGSGAGGGAAMAGLEAPAPGLPGGGGDESSRGDFSIVATSPGDLELAPSGETILVLESRASEIRLTLDFEGPVPEGLTEVEVLDSVQRRLWRGGVLEPSGASRILVTLPADTLREGEFQLRLRRRSGARLQTAGSAPFRVEDHR